MGKGALALETLYDVLKSSTKGGLKASKEIAEFRMEVCKKCPHFSGKKCEVCGCYMNLKTQLLAAKCPNGYWNQKLVEKIAFGKIDDQFAQQKCCGGN